MSLLKCPKCGEMFSDSYKTCPFCQEDEEFYNGKKKPKNPGRRVHQNKAPSIIGPAMVVVVLLLAGFLVYTFLGSDIANLFKGDDKPQMEQSDPAATPPVKDEDKDKEVVTITLDQTKTELKVGESAALKATGAEKVTWTSSDTTVATVDTSGKVTAVAAGTATITAAAEGATSATCEVTVTAPNRKLVVGSLWTKGDVTVGNVGEKISLYVTDENNENAIVENVTWSSEDTSVVTVASNGEVTAVGSGNTNIIAEVDGQKLTCVARVN